MTIETSLPKFELNATVYVKRDGERLLRRLHLRGIEYEGEVSAVVSSATETIASLIIQICPGVPADIFVPEPTAPTQIKVTLSADMFFDYNLELYLKPARP